MTVDASSMTPPISRRTLLRTAASTTVGLAGILATKTPPLYAATRTVTMLTWNHFVDASDEYLRKMAKDFGKENKCQVSSRGRRRSRRRVTLFSSERFLRNQNKVPRLRLRLRLRDDNRS